MNPLPRRYGLGRVPVPRDSDDAPVATAQGGPAPARREGGAVPRRDGKARSGAWTFWATAALGLIAGLLAPSVKAATISWVGPSTGTLLWSSPSNWEGGRVPAAGDDVRIAGEGLNLVVRVVGSFAVRSLDSTATVRLVSDIGVNTVLTVSGTFLNRGELRLESERSDRTSTLTLSGPGGLDNRGVLTVVALNGGGRRINGGIANRGRVVVQSGITVSVGNEAREFASIDGRIEATGPLVVEGGRVTISGGELSGDIRLFNATTAVEATLTRPATLRLLGLNSSLIANASPVATLRLDTDIANNTTLGTAAGAFNAGRLVMGSSRSDRFSRLEAGAGFTNAPSGVIEAVNDGGGDRNVNGVLINQGTLTATDTPLTFTGTYQSDGGRVTGDVRFVSARILSTRPPAEPVALALYGNSTFGSLEIPSNLRLRVISDIGANGVLGFNTNLVHSGAILLESQRSDRVTTLQLGALTLENRGLIRAVGTNGGGRRIEGRLTNRGQLSVDRGMDLVLANNGRVLSLESGDVTADGTFSVDGGRVNVLGGRLSGTVRLYGATTFVAPSATAEATLRLFGTASALAGNGSESMTLLLDTDIANPTTLTTLPGAENLGRIVLSSSRSDRAARMEFGAGFTNAPSGRIDAVAGDGGGRALNGTLINQGSVSATGIPLTVTGTYQSDGGTVAGDVSFVDARIVPTRVTPGPVELRLFGGGSVLAADNLENLILRVISDIGANGALLFNTNLINRGTILLESLRPDRTTALRSANGFLTNGPTGLIVAKAENGGGRAINAAFRNAGRVRLEGPLSLGFPGSQHLNAGLLELGGRTLTVSGSPLLNTPGGRVVGSGTVVAAGVPFTNGGILAPGASPGLITINGNFVQGETGGIDIEIAGGEGPGVGHDAVVVTGGSATLQGGTLVTRLIGAYVPDAEVRFRVLSASGNVTGRFARTPSLQVHPNRYLQTEYLPTALDLRTLTGVNTALPPSIVVHPASQTAAESGSVQFTVGANGTGPFTYQWRRNGTPIPGATGITLTLPRLLESDFGVYDVVVSNAAGSSTSDPASLAKSTSGGTASDLDYGDAQDPLYPTIQAHGGASQIVDPDFTLGAGIDADNGTQQNSTATADGGDEDGVVFLDALVPGQTYRIQVTHAAAPDMTPGRLSAWMDWNADGSWAEAGDRIITHRQLVRGINLFTNTVPGNAVIGFTFSRFRLYPDNFTDYAGASAEKGEVEDYRNEITTRGGEGGGGTGGATRDFGDAPDSYQTLLANDGPRHLYDATLYLGNGVDLEVDATTNILATGDDITSVPDDEDGVTGSPFFTPGGIATLTVSVVGTGKVDAWIDFNRDGDFGDANEQVLTGEAFATQSRAFSIPVPAGAKAGGTYARFRLTRNGIGSWAGPAPNGEVEDYAVLIVAPRKDWGDAPENYPTESSASGAFHLVVGDFHLGKSIDSENDGQPNGNATGDDLVPAGAADDEDGVNFTTPLVPGQQATVEVEASQAGVLDAWIDFANDGDWGEAGDKIITSRALSGGVNSIVFDVPPSAKDGPTFARFRLTRGGIATYAGDGGEGEVEDHRVVIDKDAGCELGCTGRDFWMTFPGNLAPDPANPLNPRLRFTGPNGATVTVSIPGLGFTLVTNLVAGGMTVAIPAGVDLGALNDGVLARGIHVTASEPIGVHALSQVKFTSDGFRALPTEVLTGEYVVSAWPNTQVGIPEISGSQFAIVATRPLTTVVITPSYETGSRLPGVPYSVVLTNVGDCYQLRNTNDAPADLTGTILEADFPIATFGGHVCANVNSFDAFYCDYLVEQMLPTERLASEFFTAPLATRTGGDTIRIVAARRNTVVTVNGASITLTNRGDVHEMVLAIPAHIVSTKPVQVFQLASSSDFDGVADADPFMVTVPGRAHFTAQHRFATGGTNFLTHHVNAIVPASVTSFTLNGTVITPTFTDIGTSGFKYARLNPVQGIHTLSASADFGAIVYGWSRYESYGWSSCLFFGDTTAPNLTPTTNSVTVFVGVPGADVPCKRQVPDLRSTIRVRDNCGIAADPVITQDPAPGTLVGVGTHEITFSAEDNRGNTGRCTVTLYVVDPSVGGAVTLACPADMTVRCDGSEGAIVEYEVEALRGCTPIAVSCSPPSGSRFPVGTTTVTCRITEPGVPVQVCSFDVTVQCGRKREVRIKPPTRPAPSPEIPDPPFEIDVEWDPEAGAVLEVAPDAIGPWTAVPTTGSRYTIKILRERGKFFRLRAP